MSAKDIVKVFVRVKYPEFYDRIMLVVAKFSEIVMFGETIEDGLKPGKIAYIAASPKSSVLLKKKRDNVSYVSYEGRKTPEDHHPTKVILTFSVFLPGLLYASWLSKYSSSHLSNCYFHIPKFPTSRLSKFISHFLNFSSTVQNLIPYSPKCYS